MLLLRQLPRRYRIVLLLRVTQGLSAEETGQALGMPAQQVRVLQYHALTLMRALVSDQEPRDQNDQRHSGDPTPPP